MANGRILAPRLNQLSLDRLELAVDETQRLDDRRQAFTQRAWDAQIVFRRAKLTPRFSV